MGQYHQWGGGFYLIISQPPWNVLYHQSAAEAHPKREINKLIVSVNDETDKSALTSSPAILHDRTYLASGTAGIGCINKHWARQLVKL